MRAVFRRRASHSTRAPRAATGDTRAAVRRGFTFAVGTLTLLLGAVVSPLQASTGAAVQPSATISGPATGGLHGRPYGASVVALAPWHYVEREYFASGVATAGGSQAIPAPQLGSAPSPYRTRIVVRRPVNAARFNGTVLVEWLNVSSQQDYDADWSEGYREILRGGYAYVAVSVQAQGVRTVRTWDPVRYAGLQHPGDGYAQSIYAQILLALRRPRGVDPLAGLPVRHVIADGHSQSGIDLHAFVDQVQSRQHVADGFLIRGDATTGFDVGHLRTPVLQYQSEAELTGPVGELQTELQHPPPARDSRFYRLWQVAGATHTGAEGSDYLFASLGRDWGGQSNVRWDERTEGRYDGSGASTCPSSIGVGTLDEYPQWYTLDAAIHALNTWVTTRRPPGHAPRIVVDSSGAIQRDANGNARGGVRSPVVDVPIATYHGDEGCPLSGVTKPLAPATLATLYPTHARYLAAFRPAMRRARAAGWLLPYDAADLMRRAGSR
jgi:hypothetical protein